MVSEACSSASFAKKYFIGYRPNTFSIELLSMTICPKFTTVTGFFAGCSVRNSGLIARAHSILHQRAI